MACPNFKGTCSIPENSIIEQLAADKVILQWCHSHKGALTSLLHIRALRSRTDVHWVFDLGSSYSRLRRTLRVEEAISTRRALGLACPVDGYLPNRFPASPENATFQPRQSARMTGRGPNACSNSQSI